MSVGYDRIFNMMDYRKFVIKKHLDLPQHEEKGKCVIITADPQYSQYYEEYKNYSYFMTSNPYNNRIGDISYGYCVGYIVETIPYGNGCSGKFMPIYTNKTGNQRISMNLEFKEEYKKYLKKLELKRMWTILNTLQCIKIPGKIGFCTEFVETNINIPIEIAHIIYEFVKNE